MKLNFLKSNQFLSSITYIVIKKYMFILDFFTLTLATPGLTIRLCWTTPDCRKSCKVWKEAAGFLVILATHSRNGWWHHSDPLSINEVQQEKFNEAHGKTRVVMKISFGVFKFRYRYMNICIYNLWTYDCNRLKTPCLSWYWFIFKIKPSTIRCLHTTGWSLPFSP